LPSAKIYCFIHNFQIYLKVRIIPPLLKTHIPEKLIFDYVNNSKFKMKSDSGHKIKKKLKCWKQQNKDTKHNLIWKWNTWITICINKTKWWYFQKLYLYYFMEPFKSSLTILKKFINFFFGSTNLLEITIFQKRF
jgi:hypothetical protein